MEVDSSEKVNQGGKKGLFLLFKFIQSRSLEKFRINSEPMN